MAQPEVSGSSYCGVGVSGLMLIYGGTGCREGGRSGGVVVVDGQMDGAQAMRWGGAEMC